MPVKDWSGDTALHVAADYNQGEAMKLILRADISLSSITNSLGKTALDIAKDNKYHLCMELVRMIYLLLQPFHLFSVWIFNALTFKQLQHAMEGKTSLFENVNIDWLFMDDDYADFSDDELEPVGVSRLLHRLSICHQYVNNQPLFQHTPEKLPRPHSVMSDVFISDKRSLPPTTDGVSISSVNLKSRASRRKTGEVLVDMKQSRVGLDRMRRKTTDSILSQVTSTNLSQSSSRSEYSQAC